MKRKHIEFAVGVIVGATLFGGGAAYAAGILAERSYQPIYVDGQQVQMEAYAINGHNYVKLRDVGQAVGFNVYWNGSVQIDSTAPYTGEMPTEETSAPVITEDHSQQANPAIFGGELTRQVYNAIREAVVERDAILAGTKQPVPLGNIAPYGDVGEVVVAIGDYPVYEIISQPGGGYACNVKYPDTYKGAADHTQAFANSLMGQSEREKVTAMVWYVADRLTYDMAYPAPDVVLSQDGQVPGACMAYAYSFQFLCDRAGIPCVLIRSDTHQWNKVYVDGQWWDVDVTALDAGDDVSLRENLTVLKQPSEMQGVNYVDCEPEVTAFGQELLVPGSTK